MAQYLKFSCLSLILYALRSKQLAFCHATINMSEKPECIYGEKCYRLQKNHFKDYNHQHLNLILKQTNRSIEIPSGYLPKISSNSLLQQLKIIKLLDNIDSPSTSGPTEQQIKTENQKMDTAMLKRGLNNYMEYIKKRSKGDLLTKIQQSEPYRFFMSSIAAEEKTHDETLSLSFPDLLNEKLGVIESSLQINFMVQIGWLLAQYSVNNDKSKPLTLLYGYEDNELTDLLQRNLLPNLTATYIKPSAFGSHHTKMMILSYEDKSIRVIIVTGNLVEFDWENTAQGIWLGPRLPFIEERDGDDYQHDSETNFKKDLLTYLRAYKLSALEPWIEKVKNADFREVNVFLVTSIPGTHIKKEPINWGLTRMANLLSKMADVPSENAKNWPLYYQCSSIGSLGTESFSWLLGEFTVTMSSSKTTSPFQPPVKVIYPSFDDVFSSYDGLAAGGCLPYNQATHIKQSWLKQYLCKWKSDSRFRTKSMPHIKTYCRLSPCKQFLAWFLLTSANLSKAAWGMENKNRTSLRVLNYEAGVLFIPSVLINKNRFPLTDENCHEHGAKFTMPYDIPLKPYETDDAPFLMDVLQNS